VNAEDPNEFAERQYCLMLWPLSEHEREVIERGPVFKLSYKQRLCKPEVGLARKKSYYLDVVRSNGSALSILDYFVLRADGGGRSEAERQEVLQTASTWLAARFPQSVSAANTSRDSAREASESGRAKAGPARVKRSRPG
jgi:hypothetical protein